MIKICRESFLAVQVHLNLRDYIFPITTMIVSLWWTLQRFESAYYYSSPHRCEISTKVAEELSDSWFSVGKLIWIANNFDTLIFIIWDWSCTWRDLTRCKKCQRIFQVLGGQEKPCSNPNTLDIVCKGVRVFLRGYWSKWFEFEDEEG